VQPEAIRKAANALRSGKRVALLMTGRALRADALATADRIAAATGARLLTQTSNSRVERGAGRVVIESVPYAVDQALAALADIDAMIVVGAKVPVAFFAYPGKPGLLVREDCEIVDLARPGDDLVQALAWLADELGIRAGTPARVSPGFTDDPALPTGTLSDDAVALAVARMLPEGAIVCDETISAGWRFFELSRHAAPHDYLRITGGAIGIGIPLAAGAAVACPDRKVVALQADGSGMYTVQGLWTQAREQLDVVTVIFANRNYAILQGEMRNVGVDHPGRNAERMLTMDDPALDWVSMARGMGVEAARAETVENFVRLFNAALRRRGPLLIEAMV